MINGGQSCIAGKRFIVVAEVREAFERVLVDRMQAYTFGNPRDPETKLGPLSSVEARDGIHAQVAESLAKRGAPPHGWRNPQTPGSLVPADRVDELSPSHAALR